jgi:hypothetical protein
MRPAGRETALQAIARALAEGRNPNDLPERQGIHRATWHRWVQQCKKDPSAVLNTVRRAERDRTVKSAKSAIINTLASKAVTQPKAIDLMSRATHALDMIDELEEAARGDDGRIADQDLFAEAIKLNMTSLATIARVSETLLSAQRLADMQKTVIAAIERASPEVKRAIAAEFARLEFKWGTQSPITQVDRSH